MNVEHMQTLNDAQSKRFFGMYLCRVEKYNELKHTVDVTNASTGRIHYDIPFSNEVCILKPPPKGAIGVMCITQSSDVFIVNFISSNKKGISIEQGDFVEYNAGGVTRKDSLNNISHITDSGDYIVLNDEDGLVIDIDNIILYSENYRRTKQTDGGFYTQTEILDRALDYSVEKEDNRQPILITKEGNVSDTEALTKELLLTSLVYQKILSINKDGSIALNLGKISLISDNIKLESKYDNGVIDIGNFFLTSCGQKSFKNINSDKTFYTQTEVYDKQDSQALIVTKQGSVSDTDAETKDLLIDSAYKRFFTLEKDGSVTLDFNKVLLKAKNVKFELTDELGENDIILKGSKVILSAGDMKNSSTDTAIQDLKESIDNINNAIKTLALDAGASVKIDNVTNLNSSYLEDRLGTKADKGDIYTRSETDSKIQVAMDYKADKGTTEAKLTDLSNSKADKADVDKKIEAIVNNPTIMNSIETLKELLSTDSNNVLADVTNKLNDINNDISNLPSQQEVEDIRNNVVYKVEIISTNGAIFKNDNITTTLKAVVYHGAEDVTDTIDSSRFRWTRVSNDTEADKAWNTSHFGGTKQVDITNQDVYQRATFSCAVLDQNLN